MNCAALFSADAYNKICELLGANWYAVAGTLGLAALVVIHFIYAFWLTWQNRKARGSERYAVTSKRDSVEWASQNMLVLGIIVFLGLCLHLFNFWSKMMLPELMGTADQYAADGAYHIRQTFSCWIYVVLYLIWLVALWFHLSHGFWSALHTLGWNNKVWFNRWKCIGYIYITLLIGAFALIVIFFFVKHQMGCF